MAKKIKSVVLTVDDFISLMDEAYSGGTDNEPFIFSGNLDPLDIRQDLMLAYEGYRLSKQILINELKREK